MNPFHYKNLGERESVSSEFPEIMLFCRLNPNVEMSPSDRHLYPRHTLIVGGVWFSEAARTDEVLRLLLSIHPAIGFQWENNNKLDRRVFFKLTVFMFYIFIICVFFSFAFFFFWTFSTSTIPDHPLPAAILSFYLQFEACLQCLQCF